MVAIHIQETDREIIVGFADCVIARYDKWAPTDPREIMWFVEAILCTLGHKVEVE